jgi:uncharacterized protein (DUF1330 family)
MPAYIIVQIRVTDAQTYQKYAAQVAPTIAQYDGRYLVRGGEFEVLEGEWDQWRHVVLEFPSVERARQWHASAEYAPLKALRMSASHRQAIVIEGFSPSAA